jgi:hypothetical protein
LSSDVALLGADAVDSSVAQPIVNGSSNQQKKKSALTDGQFLTGRKRNLQSENRRCTTIAGACSPVTTGPDQPM